MLSGPLGAALLLALLLPGAARADAPAPKPAVHIPHGMTGAQLPDYVPPPAYSEDLEIESGGKTITLKRSIDHGRMRTEMNVDGQAMTMIEVGDEQGTTYMLMPGEKRAMKQSRGAMEAATKGHLPKAAVKDTTNKDEPGIRVEDLGEETMGGVLTKKMHITSEGTTILGWFDKATGAPVRMESKVDGKDAVMEWKDRKVGPQPADMFTIPKGYEVMDIDAMMKQMGGAGGMPGMGGLPGMGGVGGMAKGLGGGMAGNMMGGMGANLGGHLGGMLGGPLGSIAGRYIGGKIGNAIAHKVVGGPH